MANPIVAKKCSVEGCEKKHDSHGLCSMHVSRWKRNGHTEKVNIRKVCDIEGCSRWVHGYGLCYSHLRRKQKYGDPLGAFVRPTTAERFWQFVQKTDTCWNWSGCLGRKGYGLFSVNGRSTLAHRYSFKLAYGHWPEPMALHSCDNPKCVRPEHLREGDAADNAVDMVQRGNCVNAKLTIADVKEIKSLIENGDTLTSIAPAFGVSISTISLIKSGKYWRHV